MRKQRVFDITDKHLELETAIREHDLFKFASHTQIYLSGLGTLLQVLNGKDILGDAGFEFTLLDEA